MCESSRKPSSLPAVEKAANPEVQPSNAPPELMADVRHAWELPRDERMELGLFMSKLREQALRFASNREAIDAALLAAAMDFADVATKLRVDMDFRMPHIIERS